MAHFSNWSGNLRFTPGNLFRASSEEAIIDLVQLAAREGKKVRVVGAGHSWTPLVETEDYLLNLDQLCGLLAIEGNEATVWAGTRLKELGQLLFEKNLALENLGDIDVQAIAGAISTGTHGTGVNFQTISNQISRLRMVTASGEVVTCDAEQLPDLFNAARTSLGTLGIITQITLRCQPTYKLEYRGGKESLDHCLSRLSQYNAETRNFEFYCFPYSERVQTKFINETNEAPTKDSLSRYLNDVVLENGVFGAICNVSRALPTTIPALSKLTAAAAGTNRKIDHAHRIFATVRDVRFNEMEYNIPAEKLPEALNALMRMIRDERIKVNFPIECRFVKSDNLWISPAYQRNSAYIAVHMFKGMSYREYFEKVEALMSNYGGRPHWGKMHFLLNDSLAERYPKWDDFKRLRREMDPDGRFLNRYLEKVFGEA